MYKWVDCCFNVLGKDLCILKIADSDFCVQSALKKLAVQRFFFQWCKLNFICIQNTI